MYIFSAPNKLQGGIIIIIITKKEKDYMISHGCKYHTDVFKTIGCSGGKYYLKESPKLLRILDEYRKGSWGKTAEKH